MGANILSDIVKQKRDKQVDSIIISFDETKDKLEHKRYNWLGPWLKSKHELPYRTLGVNVAK